MAIYDIFEHVERQKEMGEKIDLSTHISDLTLNDQVKPPDEKGSLFATIAASLFFFMLLITCVGWGILTLIFLVSAAPTHFLTFFKIYKLKTFISRRYLNLKRSAICFIALLVALFSPALGTMIACSYFLMYDKKGIKEVVPSILQDQFNEFFNPPHQGNL
ncbi:MAG: hypothetical protein KDK76_04010 [Chlamydiia bacterium]|nr:hypothetical protein [Chlamydiia bacterium]